MTTMSRKTLFSMLAVFAITLAACSSTSPSTSTPVTSTSLANGSVTESNDALARTDSQGSVEFVIIALNLIAPVETLDFDVTMDTHSVDLSWDLAALSTLATDAGVEVKGLSWPVGNGHHYEGTLSFPLKTADGKLLLTGAKKLILIIRDAGAPERIFEWQISQ